MSHEQDSKERWKLQYAEIASHSNLGSPLTMSGIDRLVDAAGVVEHCEELHDLDLGPSSLGEPKAVLQHPCPMAYPVDAVPGQGAVFEDHMDEGFQVQHHFSVFADLSTASKRASNAAWSIIR